jgi:N-acetylglucosamine kinase-like BadF-type ATPase
VLAVDAGGSKIDAALLRRDGSVLGASRRRGLDHDGTGTEAFLERIADAVVAACHDAGVEPDHQPVAELGMYCVAGADLPADDRRIARWFRSRGLTESDIVRNDTFAVLRAGTDRTWGVAVVCGYGTNCSAVAPNGRTFRFPAFGELSGDWGGGHDIGNAALWHSVRAEDGRGEATVLRTLVPRHFGFARVKQLSEAMYFERIAERRVVELTPIVFRAAASGDAVSRAIVDRQADEIVRMTGVAVRRLRMTKLDVDVVLGGGVFSSRDEDFLGRIGKGLDAVARRAQVRVLDEPPVVGAALLGLDAIGARPAAQRRARAALATTRFGSGSRHEPTHDPGLKPGQEPVQEPRRKPRHRKG